MLSPDSADSRSSDGLGRGGSSGCRDARAGGVAGRSGRAAADRLQQLGREQPLRRHDGRQRRAGHLPDGRLVVGLGALDRARWERGARAGQRRPGPAGARPRRGRRSRSDRRHRRCRLGLLLAGRQVRRFLDRPEHLRHAVARDLLRQRLGRDAAAARRVAGRRDRFGAAALAGRHSARVREGRGRRRRHRDGHARGHAGRRRRPRRSSPTRSPRTSTAASTSPSRPTGRRSRTRATTRARASSPSPSAAARRRSSPRTRTTGPSSPRTDRRCSSPATRTARTRTTRPPHRSTRSTMT